MFVYGACTGVLRLTLTEHTFAWYMSVVVYGWPCALILFTNTRVAAIAKRHAKKILKLQVTGGNRAENNTRENGRTGIKSISNSKNKGSNSFRVLRKLTSNHFNFNNVKKGRDFDRTLAAATSRIQFDLPSTNSTASRDQTCAVIPYTQVTASMPTPIGRAIVETANTRNYPPKITETPPSNGKTIQVKPKDAIHLRVLIQQKQDKQQKQRYSSRRQSKRNTIAPSGVTWKRKTKRPTINSSKNKYRLKENKENDQETNNQEQGKDDHSVFPGRFARLTRSANNLSLDRMSSTEATLVEGRLSEQLPRRHSNILRGNKTKTRLSDATHHKLTQHGQVEPKASRKQCENENGVPIEPIGVQHKLVTEEGRFKQGEAELKKQTRQVDDGQNEQESKSSTGCIISATLKTNTLLRETAQITTFQQPTTATTQPTITQVITVSKPEQLTSNMTSSTKLTSVTVSPLSNTVLAVAAVSNGQQLRDAINHNIETTRQKRLVRQELVKLVQQIRRLRSELKATILLTIVMVIFLCLWLPYWYVYVMIVAGTFGGKGGSGADDTISRHCQMAKYFKLLHYVNAIINPIYYVMLNSKLRNACKRLLGRFKARKSPKRGRANKKQ